MKRKKAVRAKTGWELMQLMKQHNCTDQKRFVSDDDPPALVVGYKCVGCGWKVWVGVEDLRREMERLKMLWRAVKTSKGRQNLGKALSCIFHK